MNSNTAYGTISTLDTNPCRTCGKPKWHYGDPVEPGYLCQCGSSSVPAAISNWPSPTNTQRYGWVCGFCLTSYAPWVLECRCNAKASLTDLRQKMRGLRDKTPLLEGQTGLYAAGIRDGIRGCLSMINEKLGEEDDE